VTQYFVDPPEPPEPLTKDYLLYGTAAIGADGQHVALADWLKPPSEDEGE
jgi:hypothetical protein